MSNGGVAGRSRQRLGERRPLLNRAGQSHEPEREPLYSCVSNLHSHLPVYTNIHRIRRDIVAIVEDHLSVEQFRDMRINVNVIRPLVDKLYALDDISIVYCLLVNGAQFLHEQEHLTSRHNVSYSRAILCEIVATRILRRFSEYNPGPEGLLLLAQILVAGFEPFQNAPESIQREARRHKWIYDKTLPALEVAILCEFKHFLSSPACQKVVNGIYVGRIIYTPSSFLDIIPDRYKKMPISLYDPRKAPILNQYRLIVPRTRNLLEIMQFVILLCVYLVFMTERDAKRFTYIELAFDVVAFGWVLDQFSTILEHGWHVYTQNLWSFLDVTFAAIYWTYLVLRLHGWRTGSLSAGQQGLDVLAMGAPVLIPRLAFNLMSNNMLFLSLRSMMADFTLLTVLAAWCFFGFLLSMIWLTADTHPEHTPVTITKWMLWIWFGLDGTGIQRSVDFHWLLGPILMVAFAFLGNTLFLTILVSMLSNTFSTIAGNATAEIQFRRAVLTLEGVKSDAIFAYQPPFNILAIFVILPLKFLLSPRWFHKVHVTAVRSLNMPLLLIIAIAERQMLWNDFGKDNTEPTLPRRHARWFWQNWSTQASIQSVFDAAPPDSVEDEIAVDDEFSQHLIRREFTRTNTGDLSGKSTLKAPSLAPPSSSVRRDSMSPFPGLAQQLRGILSESDTVTEMNSRLEALEESTARIEMMLSRLISAMNADKDVESKASEENVAI